jgi:hypothetical protein
MAKKKSNPVKPQKGVSEMGYRDDSPYRDAPQLTINTPTGYINMDGVSKALYANGEFLPPNSGLHYMGTDKVIETPVEHKFGGKVKNIPTWDYPSKGTPIYRDTTEIPPNQYQNGEILVADKELQDAHKQNVENWQGIDEYTPEGRKMVAEGFDFVGYPKIAEEVRQGQGKDKVPAWSAVTASKLRSKYLGAETKADAEMFGILNSSRHSDYINAAFETNRNPLYKYNAYKAAKIDSTPQVGETYFFGREETEGWGFEDFQNTRDKYSSHADVVIKKGKDKKGEYVILGGGNNVDNTYSNKKVYTKDLKNTYAGKLVLNLDNKIVAERTQKRYEAIEDSKTDIDPLYIYTDKVPAHQKAIKKLGTASVYKLAELPNMIRFNILEKITLGKSTPKEAKDEIKIALEDKNAYLEKLLAPRKSANQPVSFGGPSAFAQSKFRR